jgi:hypothetical protein
MHLIVFEHDFQYMKAFIGHPNVMFKASCML